ncbi:hypothetical protein KSP39_PZI012963 [Platanthera zijinensis]|uniref:Uncharacterized protein n=1 Tax=Platanthera zijinensis TaxID=2320716 RepID=A0AAP0G358_9ASPA
MTAESLSEFHQAEETGHLENVEDAEVEPKNYTPRHKRFEDRRRPPSCFVCKGPHHMKDCLKLGTLTTMMKKEESTSGDEEEPQEMARLSIIQCLNAMSTRVSYIRRSHLQCFFCNIPQKVNSCLTLKTIRIVVDQVGTMGTTISWEVQTKPTLGEG